MKFEFKIMNDIVFMKDYIYSYRFIPEQIKKIPLKYDILCVRVQTKFPYHVLSQN